MKRQLQGRSTQTDATKFGTKVIQLTWQFQILCDDESGADKLRAKQSFVVSTISDLPVK